MSEPTIKGRSVVLLGRFNPPIFQPAWFSHFGLLPDTEAKGAENLVVTSELTTFTADWLTCTITTNRAQFSALTESEAELRDLVLGAFEILASTPIEVVGLNTDAHLSAGSIESWHKFGHRIAPKEGLWDDVLKDPGLLGLKIQGQRSDEFLGMVNVTVEPSVRVQPGVFVGVNDHFDLRPDAQLVDLGGSHSESQRDAGQSESDRESSSDDKSDVPTLVTSDNAMKLVDQQWQTSLMKADEVIARVLSWLK